MDIKITFRIFCIAISLSFLSATLQAEIYRYVDAKGQIHFTDQPPFNQRSESLKIGDEDSGAVTKIYRYEEVVDGQRVIHLTDKPKHSGYVLIYEGTDDFGTSLGNEGNYNIHKKYAIYDSLIQQVAQSNNLEAALLHAVIQAESAYNPYAVSPKGAVGLMQLMPGTAKRYGVSDRTDIEENLRGGATYLRYLLNLFKNDKKLALAAYNAGEKAVERYGNTIPPYRETTHYVRKVMALYNLHLTRAQ